ncbi:3385_t:CDS:2 [Cetraspora pellucida]|uniref:3385_t:CDS:1 n=1 Tax=Cetraspora pellucida TaxID=1433469 RepID=A0A9N8ZZA6_9GLOM|nr:3385_t:CDS:2 [Cetraspora pellucida]
MKLIGCLRTGNSAYRVGEEQIPSFYPPALELSGVLLEVDSEIENLQNIIISEMNYQGMSCQGSEVDEVVVSVGVRENDRDAFEWFLKAGRHGNPLGNNVYQFGMDTIAEKRKVHEVG